MVISPLLAPEQVAFFVLVILASNAFPVGTVKGIILVAAHSLGI